MIPVVAFHTILTLTYHVPQPIFPNAVNFYDNSFKSRSLVSALGTRSLCRKTSAPLSARRRKGSSEGDRGDSGDEYFPDMDRDMAGNMLFGLSGLPGLDEQQRLVMEQLDRRWDSLAGDENNFEDERLPVPKVQ